MQSLGSDEEMKAHDGVRSRAPGNRSSGGVVSGTMTQLTTRPRSTRKTAARTTVAVVAVLLVLAGGGSDEETPRSSEASTPVTTRPCPPEEMIDREPGPETFEELVERAEVIARGRVEEVRLVPDADPVFDEAIDRWVIDMVVSHSVVGTEPDDHLSVYVAMQMYNPQTGDGPPARWPDDREFLPGDDLIVVLGPESAGGERDFRGPYFLVEEGELSSELAEFRRRCSADERTQVDLEAEQMTPEELIDRLTQAIATPTN